MLNELSIIQFNCNHSNYKKERPFFDSLDSHNHYIIALQEPHYYIGIGATYYPPGYVLAMSNNPATRVAFLVTQELQIAD